MRGLREEERERERENYKVEFFNAILNRKQGKNNFKMR